MNRRIFCKILLVVVAVLGLFVLSGVLSAQGNRETAFERVKAVQEAHTNRLMAIKDVEGTAIGLDRNDQPALKVFTARPGVAGIAKKLDGVAVEVVVTGKFYALRPPTSKLPKPPRILTATTVGADQINLDWKDNRELGVSYNVYGSSTSGGSYSLIEGSVGASEYFDTGLTPDTTYYYVVTAETDAGESGYSEEASATTEGGSVEPPVAPSGLSATAVSSGQINLTWQDNANNEKGFKIERGSVQIDTVGANVTSYSDTGLDPLTTYTYRVRAYNDADDSAYSNEASATTEDDGLPDDETPPAVPSELTATAVSSSQINLDWADNGELDLSHYNVYRSTTAGLYGEPIASNVTTSSYSDSGLVPETTYYYVVTAVDTSDNESANSPEASATTEPAPEKPSHWCERPVPIGVSTGHPDITAGTIGCRVTDGTYVYALSNNHVYANENLASIGDNVLQPGTFDDGVDPDDAIGTIAGFEPIVFHPRRTNTIDAAIALTTTDKLGNATPLGDPDYPDGYGTPSSTIRTDNLLGLPVQKYGRTTLLKKGVITDINVTVRVGYSTRSAIFVNQIIITPGTFSAGGDSGSLIVTDDGDKNPVGLLFAGSSTHTVANPIDAVLDAFGVTIDGE